MASGAAVHVGRRVTVDDVMRETRWAEHHGLARAHGIQAAVAVPVVGEHGALRGAITLYLRQGVGSAADAAALLEALAPLAATALERGRALDTLRESEERYRTLVEGLSAVIFQTGAGGKLSFISAPFAAAGGVTPASAIGHELADFFHPDDRQRLVDAEREILAGGRHEAHLELRVLATFAAIQPFDDLARRLPRPEARYACFTGDLAVRRMQRLFQPLFIDFDVELDTALREPFKRYLHRRAPASLELL
jgi:PAS domain-containing protein